MQLDRLNSLIARNPTSRLLLNDLSLPYRTLMKLSQAIFILHLSHLSNITIHVFLITTCIILAVSWKSNHIVHSRFPQFPIRQINFRPM